MCFNHEFHYALCWQILAIKVKQSDLVFVSFYVINLSLYVFLNELDFKINVLLCDIFFLC